MNKNTRSVRYASQCLYLYLCSIILLFFFSCNENAATDPSLPPLIQTPREAYLAALDANGLGKTQMAKAWRLAGEQALEDSILVASPFQETGYMRADAPAALTYRLALKTGEALHIELTTAPDSTLFFVDFFLIEPTDSTQNFRHLFSAENYRTDSLVYEVQKAGTYLLRIQPELLASCRYTVKLIVQPVYGIFPVSGKGNRDIWSFFGDPRDGGKRRHKGIDIFARRGTPVVAPIEGVVRSTRNRGRGGKQIWLYDHQRRQSLYYAHLDSQLVKKGQLVQAGDTLGLIGNTGNARNTPAHLHFSIYRRGQGAIDPLPFVKTQVEKAPAVRADTSRLGQLARVRRRNTRLWSAPQNRSTELAILNRHLPLQIIAASKKWYRVSSPDGLSGYLPANGLEGIGRAIDNITIGEATELLQSPYPKATPVAALQPKEQVAVIGKNGSYQFVRGEDGEIGWVEMAAR